MRKLITGTLVAFVAVAALSGCSGTHQAAAGRTTKASAGTPVAVSTPSHVDNPAADAAAAAVLNAEDGRLAAGIAQGKQVIGTSAGIAWWKSFGDADRLETEILNTFKTADAHFNASDEAPSISTWRNTILPGDVQSWYLSDTGSGPSASTTQQVDADLTALDTAAASVAKGQ